MKVTKEHIADWEIRHCRGESMHSLTKEYGVAYSTIRYNLKSFPRWMQQARNKYWESKNLDKVRLRKKEDIKRRRKRDPEKARKYERDYKRNRQKKDIQYKIAGNLRSRLSHALRRDDIKRGSAVRDLGCSLDKCKLWLEMHFQPGMTWANYGEWHIDHIRPLVSFDLTDKEHVKQACHFTNLQPLWAKENFAKGGR